MPIICYRGCLQLTLTQMHIILLPWMPAPLSHADACTAFSRRCLYPCYTDACNPCSRRCLQFSLMQMPISLLPWMPAIFAHADAHIIATMDACHFDEAEGGNLANSTGASNRSATTTPCLLTSMRRWRLDWFPSSYHLGGPRFTSLRHVTPNISGNRSSPRLIFTDWGHYRGRDPFGGSSQISAASYQCKHSLTQCGTIASRYRVPCICIGMTMAIYMLLLPLSRDVLVCQVSQNQDATQTQQLEQRPRLH